MSENVRNTYIAELLIFLNKLKITKIYLYHYMYLYCTVRQYVELAARMIAETMETSSGRKIVVEKSTVPVRAAESIANILRYLQSGFRTRPVLRRLREFISCSRLRLLRNF